jgi:hypothetical protein
MKSLLVLVADKDAEFLFQELLVRFPRVEHIAEISFDIITHPQRDPGVINHSVELLRPYVDDYNYLMICCDHEGSGRESISREMVENELEQLLSSNGWQGRNVCILVDPEIESWLWVHEAKLHELVDWENERSIYDWIRAKGFQFKQNLNKPVRPKEAFEETLKFQNIPKSSSLFATLAKKASYKRCNDPSFQKLLETLKRWFQKEEVSI